jgi:hypothetical protein
MQRKCIDLVHRNPAKLVTFVITDDSIEGYESSRNDRGVRPETQIEDARVEDLEIPGRNVGLLIRFAKRGILGGLPRLAGATRNAPGATEMTPRDTMLQQDANGRVPDNKTGRAEATPEPLPVRTLDPGIPRITLTDRRKRGWKTHSPSLPCLRLASVQQKFSTDLA